jgi:hypothetical protein
LNGKQVAAERHPIGKFFPLFKDLIIVAGQIVKMGEPSVPFILDRNLQVVYTYALRPYLQ